MRIRASVNDWYFTHMDHQDKWYILGYLMADGYIDLCGNNCRVGVSSIDHDIIKRVAAALCYTGNITQRQSKQFPNSKTQYILRVSSKQLVQDLCRLGCVPRKTTKMNLPDMPDRFRPHFLRGYFDGDGSICMNNSSGQAQVSFTGHNEFLKEIQVIIHNILGIRGHLSQVSQNGFMLQFGGNRQVESFVDYIYQDANIYLDRKFQKAMGVLA